MQERVQWTGGSVFIYRWVLRLLGASNNLSVYHPIPLLADDDSLKRGRANSCRNMSRNCSKQQQTKKKKKWKENRAPWKLKPVVLLQHMHFHRESRRGCTISFDNKCQETQLLPYMPA